MPTAAPDSTLGPGNEPLAKVLVVEDDLELCHALQLALARSLISADTVNSAEAALTLMATNNYDLILLDIALPGMDGLEMCRQLKLSPRFRRIPVIIVSGQISLENKEEALRVGAVDFIEKPFLMLNFLSRIMGHVKLRSDGEPDIWKLWRTPAA